jgi:mono/diheme cytochrome c family protein
MEGTVRDFTFFLVTTFAAAAVAGLAGFSFGLVAVAGWTRRSPQGASQLAINHWNITEMEMNQHLNQNAVARSEVHYNGFRSVLVLATALATFASVALAQDDSKVKAGLEAWKTAGCADCHGSFADGDKARDEAPTGANLRQTRLNAAALTETIRCGRPMADMPKFDADAYTKRACYGKPLGPVPDALYPTPRALSPSEIEAVVAYLQARIIGHGKVTPAECAAYYGEVADQFCGP